MKRDIESEYSDVDLPDASNPSQTTLSRKIKYLLWVSHQQVTWLCIRTTFTS